jgi:hypothetical protein
VTIRVFSPMRNEPSLSDRDEARRFRPTSEWFVASRDRGVYVARIGTTAERALDLMQVLAAYLDPTVDVVIDDVRSGAEWLGVDVPLPALRDVLGRLRVPLATFGGVELTVIGPDDQLSLTPELLIVIYSRSDRWYFLLDGLGLRERAALPAPTWASSRSALKPSPELAAALTAAAARLGLCAGTPRRGL